MPKPKVLFLLADGARARFVECSAETGRFVRFSTASSMAQLQEAAARLKGILA